MLTHREKQIAGLISYGYLEKEISYRLHISRNTVHCFSRNIRQKWNAGNIADITRRYITDEIMSKKRGDDEMDKIDLLMWIDAHFSYDELNKLVTELKKMKNDDGNHIANH
jgi:DNA-binding CsgD family transcriptional regulator